MTDLASLVVRLIADTNRFRGDLNRAANDLNAFQRFAGTTVGKVAIAAGAAAAAVGVAMIAMGKSAIDAADNLNDLSKQTGISTEALSQLEYAAEQSGTDLEGLTTGLRKFVRESTDAASKAGAARDAFSLIGVSVSDAAGTLKPTEQLLLDVAERFSQYEDGAAKAAFAQELFGKSGAALIPFLNEGRTGIERLMKEADRLGLTLKGTTAQAADDFNDNLGKLKSQVAGIGLQIAEEFLPALIDITKAFSEMLATKSDLSGFFKAISTGFRAVAYLGVATADAFKDVGRLLGAFYAAEFQLLQGNLDQVKEIYRQWKIDAVAAEEATNKQLARIWGEREEDRQRILGPRRMGSYLTDAQRQAAAANPFFKKPDFPTPKEVVDQLQEVEVKFKKLVIPEDFFAEFQNNTQTSLERAFIEFNTKKAQLNILRDENQLSKDAEVAAQIYIDRLKAIENEFLGVLTAGTKEAKEATKEINEFQLQAARNTQDIIADTFEGLATGADISFKSILQSFGQMLIRLAAQAAAADLAGRLFGEAGGGTKGTSGWVGTAAGLLGGLLKRDSGGRGRKGGAYMIGTGAQPEMFIPDRPGTFVPAGAGPMQVSNTFLIQSSEPVSRRTEMQIAAAASRGIARANRRNN